MPTIPCCTKILCPAQPGGDLEFDFPLANFSSEAPDPVLFFSGNFGWDNNVPPLGINWGDGTALAFCQSSLSQDDADLCSARTQFTNMTGGGGGSNPGWTNGDGTPVNTATNDQQQCSFTCPDGLLFTWTVAAGAVVSFNKAQANEIAASLACNFARLRHLCLPALPFACLDVGYKQTITPQGGTPPFTFTLIGSVPPGLSLTQVSPTSAALTGTPTQAGNFNFTILVADARGNFMQKQYSFEVLGITNLSGIPAAQLGVAYSFQLNGAGGTAPYTFSLLGGSLPTGLNLSTTGVIQSSGESGNLRAACSTAGAGDGHGVAHAAA
jgi:hypothetical protein